ncbi:GNAT family N-acetyltransferase [Kangiella sp. TOML190]|uniref:GNAT family N-acetyltransferase n=1 Tax=Kangiella sp. TOML190 TaxID=2931351 RepID=UPI002041864B|nr:GNAT family N-acetyltransferase [Kangiella sp. TOML190]
MGGLNPPELLTKAHKVADFDCGQELLNEWLNKRSLKNQKSGASRTFVVCEKDSQKIAGYFSLATGAIERTGAPSSLSRNMPDPIPIMVLGQLAIDKEFQGSGIGRGLLKEALLRTLRASKHVGFRAVFVHALTEDVKRFYLNFGFQEYPKDPMTLYITLPSIEAHLK